MKNKMYLASAVLPSLTQREMQKTSFKSFQNPYHFFFGQYSTRFLFYMIVSLSVDVICHTVQKFAHPLQSSNFDNALYISLPLFHIFFPLS